MIFLFYWTYVLIIYNKTFEKKKDINKKVILLKLEDFIKYLSLINFHSNNRSNIFSIKVSKLLHHMILKRIVQNGSEKIRQS